MNGLLLPPIAPTPLTNSQCPYFVTNWWTVTGVPVDNPSGSGTSACFTPTNPAAGSGTVTFYGTWKNSDPCTGQPVGGGTASKSQSFTVIGPSCDNPHPFNATAYECYHGDNNPGTQCSTAIIIQDVISTYTCDLHTNNNCAGNCNLTDDPSTPEEVQTLYVGSCPGGDASQEQLWVTLHSGCTSCGTENWYNACVIGQLPPGAVKANSPPANKLFKKKPCQ